MKGAFIENTSASRLDFLDFVKGIAIMAVIAGHCGPVPSSIHVLFVFSFHIPIFFIISGFLLADKNTTAAGSGETLNKNFRRLIIPYFVTGLLIYVLSLAVEFYYIAKIYYSVRHDIILSIKDSINFTYTPILNIGKQTLINFCYGTSKRVVLSNVAVESVGYLWFLPALFCANMIFYFFLKLFEKSSNAIQAIVIILLASAGYVIGMYVFLPWGIQIALASMVFVYSGYLMRKYKIYEKKAPVWLIAAALGIWILDIYVGGINMMMHVYNNPALSVTGAIAATYLIMKLGYFLSAYAHFYFRAVAYIGKRTLVIYCFHVFDILAFSPVIESLALGFLFENNLWPVLASIRLAYTLLIAQIVKFLPVFKSVYYPVTSRKEVS